MLGHNADRSMLVTLEALTSAKEWRYRISRHIRNAPMAICHSVSLFAICLLSVMVWAFAYPDWTACVHYML